MRKIQKKSIRFRGFQCARCGYKWIPYSDGIPLTCPKCRTRKWMISKEDKRITEDDLDYLLKFIVKR